MSFTEGRLFRTTVILLLLYILVTILIVGKQFLIPLAWATIISFASIRLLTKIERKLRINRMAIIMLFIFAILIIIILIVYFFYWEIANIVGTLPSLGADITQRLHEFAITLKSFGINIPEHIDQNWISMQVELHHDLVVSVLSSLSVTIADIFLICFYLFFMLYYQGIIVNFIKKKFRERTKIRQANEILSKIQILTNNYIIGLLLITLATFVLNYVVLLIFNLKFALFFALFVSILSLIPYIGYPLGTLVIFLFAVLTKDSFWMAILTAAFVYGNNIIQENVLRPWLVGDQLKINAFMVFLFIIVGGIIWGIAGMVLFLPIVGIIKIFLESNPDTAPYAIFLSDTKYEIPKFADVEKEEEN